jgi:hypothetical protein
MLQKAHQMLQFLGFSDPNAIAKGAKGLIE